MRAKEIALTFFLVLLMVSSAMYVFSGEETPDNEINAIIFAHKDDVFEDPKTLSFFENFKDLNLIDYSELKPTTCTYADGDKKMTSDKGHNIPQSKCFTKYLEDKNYLISFLKNIGLAGGFLFIAINGPKDFAVERKKKFVRL